MCLFELFAEITLGKIIHGNVDESSACWLVAVMMMVVRVANAAPLFDDHNACQKVSIIRIVGFTFAKIEYRLHITQRVRTHTHTHTRSTNYACMRLSYKTRSLFFPLSRRLVCVYKCKYKWSESADFIPIFKNDDNGSRICFESGFSFLFILKSIYLGWFASVTCSSLFFRLFSSFVFKIFSHRGWCFFFSLHSPAFSLSFIALVIEIDTRWNAFFQIDWN